MRAKLHELIDQLDDDILQPALHKAVDTLPDEAVPRALKRLLGKRMIFPSDRKDAPLTVRRPVDGTRVDPNDSTTASRSIDEHRRTPSTKYPQPGVDVEQPTARSRRTILFRAITGP